MLPQRGSSSAAGISCGDRRERDWELNDDRGKGTVDVGGVGGGVTSSSSKKAKW